MSFKEIIKNVFMNKGENKMKEVVEFLQANPVQYLATVGRFNIRGLILKESYGDKRVFKNIER